jgi:hypothetical protein
MKKQLLLLTFALATTFSTNAAVLTVSNNANSPGQYNNFIDAHNAAVANDTLYIHGSPNSYGYVTITKPLTIIGAGGLPNKSYNLSSRFENFTIDFNNTYTSSGSGSKLIGLDVQTINLSGGNGSVTAISNVTLERNKVAAIYFNQAGTYTLAHNNINIYNNVISSIGGNNTSTQFLIKNTVIKNNIITGQIYHLGHESAGSWILSNNIILGEILGSIRSAVISNNIFYKTGSGSAFNYPSYPNEYCSTSNNIFFGSYSYSASDIVYGTNTGDNNILNQNPQFLYYEGANTHSYTHTNPPTGPFNNFNLSSGSPGKNVGSDGTDIGIYGGNTPFVEGANTDSRYRYFPMPAIPQIMEVTIQNASVPQNGTLNVNFKARK